MAFPDNNFEQDQLEDDQYGGRPADEFTSDTWTWITGLVRSISKRFLSHVRQAFSSQVVLVQESVAIGDVIAIDTDRDAVDPNTQAIIPYVAKYGTIYAASGSPRVVGVVVAAASALTKAQYAAGGLLSQQVTGLSSMTADAQISVDPATSRLRALVAGDDALGYSTPSGNVLLSFAGRVA